MIIVFGKLKVPANKRTDFIIKSTKAIIEARNNPECLDFAISPDSVESDRVNVYEAWSSKQALDEFRGSGPNDGLFDMVETFDIQEYEVNESNNQLH